MRHGLSLALAGFALAGTMSCVWASDLPLVPTDGECVVTRQFEDGSATALCGDGSWAFDADGSFVYMHGIKFWIYPEGTWHEVK